MRLTKICIFIVCFGLVPSAFALRCGTHLIEEGDGFSRVSKLCGEPTSVQTRSIFRTRGGSSTVALAANANSFVEGYDQVSVEIVLEEWEYNFGPNRLSRRIIFEDGVVSKIKSIGYGY